jgi:uncharacterized membrane protein (DUF485 family)
VKQGGLYRCESPGMHQFNTLLVKKTYIVVVAIGLIFFPFGAYVLFLLLVHFFMQLLDQKQ